jgi:hypothetical protein
MPEDPEYSFGLPSGISRREGEDISRKLAPLLRLHRHEPHLPESPERFRENAAFRESNWEAKFGHFEDRTYHKRLNWQDGPPREPDYRDYLDIPWDIVRCESHRCLPPERFSPMAGHNVRPHDTGNIYDSLLNKGLFFELGKHVDRCRSGAKRSRPAQTPKGKSWLVKAPVFFDIAYDRSAGLVKILFWFFYELNRWGLWITHEGDWEHISLVFAEEDFHLSGYPSYVYFAQHNGGVTLRFSDLEMETVDGGVHPVVYVDRNGHPCHPAIILRHKYNTYWKTWEDLSPVIDHPWCDFGGAWGKVGVSTVFTGPLGPLFKRHADSMRIVRRYGRLYVRVPPTWR